MLYNIAAMYRPLNIIRFYTNTRNISTSLVRCSIKKYLDYTNFPKLDETDLDEQFVRGSGPGGQSVNKTSNCVVLVHKPTGIVVKCHHTRSLDQNRKIARTLLLSKLDNHLNNDMSIDAQSKRYLEMKSNKKETKRKKLEDLKQQWKDRENLL